MNPTENKKLGLGLNLLEALNLMMLEQGHYAFVYEKIQKVIELMDEVLC